MYPHPHLLTLSPLPLNTAHSPLPIPDICAKHNQQMKTTLLIVAATLLITQLHAQSKTPSSSFRDCKDCPEMVVVPAGSFTIGTPATEADRDETEGPQKKISINKLAVGKYDITKAEWAAFAAATNRPTLGGCAFSGFTDTTKKFWEGNPSASWNHLGFAQTDKDPVVCITWQDAVDYTQWLSKKTGAHYRLLSEAEWEYAARAGTTTAFYWGTSGSHEYANYGADSNWTGLAKGRDKWMATSPVGSFPPNAFGLYDMVGNVLQYTANYFSPSYDSIPTNGSAYTTDVQLSMTGSLSYMNNKKSSAYRMVRGGDWGDPPFMIRAGFRNWAPGRGFTIDTYRSGGVGFRVARTL